MPSNLIRKTGYDPQTRTLFVWLQTTANRYEYDNVPPETYEEFRQAFSKGRFFNRYIRDRYKYRVVPPGQ